MRLFFILIIFAGIEFYTFTSLRSFFEAASRSLRWFEICYWVLSICMFAYLLAVFSQSLASWPNTLHIYIRAFIFIIFFSKLIFAVFIFVDDIRRALLWLTEQGLNTDLKYTTGRSSFIRNAAVVMAAIPFVTLSYGILRNAYRYQLRKIHLQLKNWPQALDGFKIVQISDIHSGSFTRKDPIREVIAKINALKPDLIVFTGDLVNNISAEVLPYIDIFQKLEAPLGVFAILGNHDYGDYHQWSSPDEKRANFEVLLNVFEQLNWKLLRNENEILSYNGEQIALIGVENFSAIPRFPKYGDLAKACEGCHSVNQKILLSHDPTHWEYEVTSQYPDISLTLSGHTHGFQFGIEIPNWIKWSPAKYIYKQWAGLYQQNEQYLYVNRGFGVLGYPGRVGILPEVTLFSLNV